jgi:hypothetical protein
MQPAQARGGGSSSSIKKWGPIAAIVAVVAIVAGVVIATSGGGGSSSSDTTTPAATTPTSEPRPAGSEAPVGSTAGGTGAITFPLSFSQAKEQGITGVEWGKRCDTATGNVAVPDYFAPECYAPFTGDNGGATAPGVTADSIKVVYYLGPDADPIINYVTDAIKADDTNAQATETLQKMRDYYEQFYEMYGRKIDLQIYEGTGNANDEVAARADAVRIAEDIKPFAVLGGPALTNAFADELAARKVMCISCTPSQPPDWQAARDPYVWGIGIGADQSLTHVQEFITKQLIGKNAEHAGDPALQSQPRKFGAVYIQTGDESKKEADKFVANLTAAGADVAEVLPYQLDPSTIQASAAQIVSKLKASGVTSVIFSGDPIAPRDFTKEATAQEYFPEWIVAASALVDTTAFSRTYDQQQWAHAFGVSHLAARQQPETSGYYSLYKWFSGQEPPAKDTIGVLVPQLALFSGAVQAMGPDVTVDNFKKALFATKTKPAISQPFLSWGTGLWPAPDYDGIDDATAIWWDPNATGPDEIRKQGTGMWQYVDGGKRYLPGKWPTDEKLFDPNGAVAIYTTPPPGEAPPTYPSPAG